MTTPTVRSSDASVSPSPRLLKWLARYKALALFCFNIFAVLFLLNFALGLQNWSKQLFASSSDPVTERFGTERVNAAYGSMKPAEVSALLIETWNRPMVFQDFTHFRERPSTGKFVNVHDAGFRISSAGPGQGPWPVDPKNFNVFVFGGSTAFGYGVADDQTIASHMQELLNRRTPGKPFKRVCIYNFAAGFYYSTQERIQFQELLVKGHKPDAAVFIDGLNEFAADNLDGTAWSAATREYMDGVSNKPSKFFFGKWFAQTPLGRAAGRLLKAGTGAAPSTVAATPTDDERARAAIDRYLANVRVTRAIAAAEGVPAIFVWQPVPQYRYDLKFHAFNESLNDGFIAIVKGHELMQAMPKPQDTLWLADAQEPLKENLYIDRVHYAPKLNRLIAANIAEKMGQ